ncbi:MAG: orotidine-5'-phosphate decarboxylase [Actinomycetota bacterium]|nr:orotidine-5'-phosphate decarboxylase [Actinomycetota bacterium]
MTRASAPVDLANPLCVALDGSDPRACVRLAGSVAPAAGLLKVGLTSFAAGGPSLVAEIRALAPVFLDLKLHDIPAQVRGAVEAIAELGVAYTTVHASGGTAMLRAAADAGNGRVVILAVTVLTSLTDGDLTQLGIDEDPKGQVLRLGELALEAGIDGLVCSPREVGALRARFGHRDRGGPLLVVPGIRPAGSVADDQQRVMSAREAIGLGADVIVVGRPITASADPAAAAHALVAEIA